MSEDGLRIQLELQDERRAEEGRQWEQTNECGLCEHNGNCEGVFPGSEGCRNFQLVHWHYKG
jgi:hypothetical protein